MSYSNLGGDQEVLGGDREVLGGDREVLGGDPALIRVAVREVLGGGRKQEGDRELKSARPPPDPVKVV